MTKMDLQLFADGLIGAGVEDDGPNEKDNLPEVEVEEDDDVDFESLLGKEEPEEPEIEGPEEQEEIEKEEPEKEEPEKEEPEEQPDGKFYTQAEIDALISSRLQRERQKFSSLEGAANYVRQLEKAAGMPIGDIVEHVKGNRVQAYVDEGMDEEKARKQVEQELHFEELQERVHRSESYIQNMNRSMQYERQKSAFLSKNTSLTPYYKKFEDEIDDFAAFGENLSFEDAAKYIIGDKIASGELLDDIRKGTENKLLANSKKRGKATIESGSQAGGKGEVTMSSLEKKFAREFGFSEKEWMDSKKALNKKRSRR